MHITSSSVYEVEDYHITITCSILFGEMCPMSPYQYSVPSNIVFFNTVREGSLGTF